MHRRHVIAVSAGALLGAIPMRTLLAQATPEATPLASAYPELPVTLADDGLVIPATIAAGLTTITVTHTGEDPATHWLFARLVDPTAQDRIAAFLTSDGAEGSFEFEQDLVGVGAPDWSSVGGTASGVVQIDPGSYLALDVFGGRGFSFITTTGAMTGEPTPESDLAVTLKDMVIGLPETSLPATPQRWRFDNIGAVPHEVSIVPIPADFSEDDLAYVLGLPEDATPTPGQPWLDYAPIAGIGVMQAGLSSWLDVNLPAGRYLALCPAPFGTGYPHVMDGMYAFLDFR